MIPRPLWIAILVCAMVAADLLVPVLWGTVSEGLAVVEAHKGDPPKDPVDPQPVPERPRDDPAGPDTPGSVWYWRR